MLITEDNQREGWLISSNPKSLEKLGTKVQDSSKQNFLFCPECEEKLGVLERYIANHFYNRYKEPAHSHDFPLTKGSGDGMDYITANGVNPVMFKLFIYSLVWRASVSTDPVFNNFKLPEEFEEGMRKLIDSFLKDSEAETQNYIQQHGSEFTHLPINIITSEVASNPTANLVQPFMHPDGNKVLLFANEFILILHLDWQAPLDGHPTYNFASSPVTVGSLPLKNWEDYHADMVKFMVNQAYNNKK